MIKLKLESSWEELKMMLLEAEPQLSPEDLDAGIDQEEELIKKLSHKLNRSNEEIVGWIESVSSNRSKAS